MGVANGSSTEQSNHSKEQMKDSIPPSVANVVVTSARQALKGYGTGVALSLIPRLLALLGARAFTTIRGSKKAPKLTLSQAVVSLIGKSFKGDLAAFLAVLLGGIPAFEGLAAHLTRLVASASKSLKLNSSADAAKRDSQDVPYPLLWTFIATWLASYLAVRQLSDRGRRTDLMLFAVVRAGDILLRGMSPPQSRRGHHPHHSGRHHGQNRTLKELALANSDTLVFAASCFVIMWCWFYEPLALPRSYSKWIFRMSELHPSLHRGLRLIREGRLHYGQNSPHNHLLFEVAEGYGMPSYFGDIANFGPDNPHGFQQIPCLLVHKGLTDSCPGHWKNVWVNGFKKAIVIYFPIHVLARVFSLATRKAGTAVDYHEVVSRTLKDILFSSSFLSTFIALVWAPICTLRSHILPPGVADAHGWGPGLGSALCGFSILLERKSRRRELALFVLPRAIYALGFLLLGKARLAEAMKIGSRKPKPSFEGPPPTRPSSAGALKVWERILVDAVAWPMAVAALVTCYRADRDHWFGKSGGWAKFLVGFVAGEQTGSTVAGSDKVKASKSDDVQE